MQTDTPLTDPHHGTSQNVQRAYVLYAVTPQSRPTGITMTFTYGSGDSAVTLQAHLPVRRCEFM